MDYFAIRNFHIACAVSSISLFVLRGICMMRASPLLQRRWVRVAPHIVDTLLLASALVMVIWSGQYPFVEGWLTAKVLALIAYIVLGTVALRRGRNKTERVCAFIAAIAVFSYIVAVATSKQVLVFT